MRQKSKISRWIDIFIRTILILVGLEIGIRLAEFGYYFYFERIAVRKHIDDTSTYRIVCIGESTVRGHGVEKGEDFPSQLQNILNISFPSRKIKVYNLGIDAIDTQRIYNNLDYILNYYTPHLVVLCAGNNRLELPYIFQKIRNKRIIRTAIFVNDFKLVRLARLLTVCIKRYSINDKSPLFSICYYPSPKTFSPSVLTYQFDNKFIAEQYRYKIGKLKSMVWMDRIVKKLIDRKFKTVICNYFDSWINSYLKNMAVEHDLYFVDNERIFRDYLRAGKRDEILSGDRWHPNNKGYYLIAENIYDTLIDTKLIK